MKKVDIKLLGMLSFLCLLNACSSGGGDIPTPPPTPPEPTPVVKKIPISLNCGVSSRVTDSNYETGDKVGLYVVNYEGGSAGTLQVSGNHASNVAFSYDGSKWASSTTLYWKDDQTKADFYVYYPYGSVTSVTEHPFSVKKDQSSASSYQASEFLYGVSKNVAPVESAVNVTTYHLMSNAVVKLVAGEGFSEAELNSDHVSVSINGLKTDSKINLRTGEVVATGETHAITPLNIDGTYKALVVPQVVSAEDFIAIEIDGQTYKMPKDDFTFVSGKRHSFTVTVSKKEGGINVNIADWEDDGIDNGGTAE